MGHTASGQASPDATPFAVRHGPVHVACRLGPPADSDAAPVEGLASCGLCFVARDRRAR